MTLSNWKVFLSAWQMDQILACRYALTFILELNIYSVCIYISLERKSDLSMSDAMSRGQKAVPREEHKKKNGTSYDTLPVLSWLNSSCQKNYFCFKNQENFSRFPNECSVPQCEKLLIHCKWGCLWKAQGEGRETAPDWTAAAYPKWEFSASALFVRQPMLLLTLLNSG